MKWVLTTPEIEIQPRDSSSTIIAYVVRSRPIPPYSSGMVTPNRPSSFICSTTASGNLSSWSCSSAMGMTCSSTNWPTMSVIAFCSSVLSLYWLSATAMGSGDAPGGLIRGARAPSEDSCGRAWGWSALDRLDPVQPLAAEGARPAGRDEGDRAVGRLAAQDQRSRRGGLPRAAGVQVRSVVAQHHL